MPKFAILLSKGIDGYWSYILVIEHKMEPPSIQHENIDAAYKAAKHAANLRGYVNV